MPAVRGLNEHFEKDEFLNDQSFQEKKAAAFTNQLLKITSVDCSSLKHDNLLTD
jgi:hypothetical protein